MMKPKGVLKKPPVGKFFDDSPTLSEHVKALEELERENKRLDDERGALRASLHSESIANEEQAAYIEILKRTLDRKLEDFGLGGQGQLICENELLRDKLSRCQQRLNETNATVSRLEEDIELYRKHESIMESSRSLPVASGGWAAESKKTEELRSDIASLYMQVEQLEKEKTALLDYTQESLSKTSTLTNELEHLENFNKVQTGEKVKLEQQLKEQMLDNSAMLAQLQEQDEEIAGLKEELQEIKKVQAQEKEQRETEETKRLNEQIEEMKTALKEKDGEIEELMSMQVEMLTAVKELQNAKPDDSKDIEIAGQRATISRLEKELASYLETSSEKISALKAENAKLSEELTLKDVELQSLSSKTGTMEQELSFTRKKYESRKTKLVDLKRQGQSTSDLLGKIRADWEGAESRLAAELSDKNQLVDSLNEKLESQMKKCEQFETELAALEDKYGSFKDREELQQTKLDNVERELSQAREENRSLLLHIQKYQQQIADLQTELTHTKEKEIFRNKITEAAKVSEVLASKGFQYPSRESLERTLAENRRSIDTRNRAGDDSTLIKALEQTNYQLEKQMVLVTELEKTLYVAKNENSMLNETISAWQHKCDDLQLRVETKQTELDHATRTLSTLALEKSFSETDFVAALKRELLERSKELSVLQTRSSDIRIRASTQASEYQLQIGHLQAQIARLQAEIDSMEKEARAAIEERDVALSECVNMCVSACESIREDCEKACQSFKNELKLSKDTITSLETTILQMRDSLDMSNKDNLRLARQLDQSQNMQHGSMDELNDCYSKLKDLDSKLNNKTAEVQFLQTQIKVLKSAEEPARSSISELEYLRRELQLMYDTYRKEQNHAIDLSNKIGELQLHLETLQHAKRDSPNMDSNSQENHVLQVKLDEANSKIDILKKQLIETEAAFETARRRAEALELENEHLTRKVEELTKLALSSYPSIKKDRKEINENAKRFEEIQRTLTISQQKYGPTSKKDANSNEIEERLNRLQNLYTQ